MKQIKKSKKQKKNHPYNFKKLKTKSHPKITHHPQPYKHFQQQPKKKTILFIKLFVSRPLPKIPIKKN